MDENQQQNPQVNSESPNTTTQSTTAPEGQQTPAQFMDIPEHQKTSPAKKILKISFIFLSLSALIIAGYYLYTLLTKEKTQSPAQLVSEEQQSSPTPTLSPKPTVTDPTANWEVYKNDKAGIEFKYPPDWIMSGGENVNWVLFFESPEKLKLSIVSNKDTLMNECFKELSKEERIINGNSYEIVKFVGVFAGEMCDSLNNPNNLEIWATTEKSTVGISFNYTKTNQVKSEGVFDQILSTFEFLE